MIVSTSRWAWTLRVAGLFFLLWASAASASAGPADCVGELNEAQQTTGKFCKTWLPCAWVMSIQETCTQTRTWLTNLGTVSRSEDLTVSRLEQAARGSSAVELRNEVDGPALVNCLPGFQDKALCRQYLGIDPIPVRVAAPPKPRDPDLERRARMLALYKEEETARLRLGGPWWTADSALAACAQARAQASRATICERAQSQVDACRVAGTDWSDRKRALLAEIDRLSPGLGQEQTPGLSPLRGLGQQATPAQMWSDTVYTLRAKEMPACPDTLPSTTMTPAQALAAWAGEEAKLAADLSRCDGLSRDAFEAIDDGDADRAAALTDTLDRDCSRLSASYANRVELARRQIGVLRAAATMPARSPGYGTSLFKTVVQQAHVEAQDPAARQARLRDEREALERMIASEAASGRDSYNPMNVLLGVMQTVVAVQNARNAASAAAYVPPAAAYTPQAAAVPPTTAYSGALPDPGFHSPQAAQPSSAATNAQFLAQRRAQTEAMNRQAAQAAEDLRNRNAQMLDALKYYAPLSQCAVVDPNPRGLSQCIQNRCGEKISVSFSGGRVDVSPGNCYPVSGIPTIQFVCRWNDRYYPDRRQCKRP